ncbi:MAG: Aspartate/ornithine carbamoyltransferase [Olpidium bornovanus]|uniref:ornithine carbamoyltransferase n=1 Tax=Olpidium bornovanus TaxID=278681 RepID=A0A8H7ZX67_9FUNG|nr:MAG: Aspartate/ornithine carbamoyltransferase [Olpidium bornovanus]
MVRHSAVPVINALSDKYHPTQILADLLTLHEVYGGRPGPAGVESSSSSSPPPAFFFGRNLRVAWVGDANNVLNELMVALPKVGINLRVATPEKYPVQGDVLEIARADAAAQGTQVTVCHDPREAVDGADVIVTDTWISMGQESEKAQRLADFTGFRVCEALARRGGAKEDWKFMHCLPRKQEEVDDQVLVEKKKGGPTNYPGHSPLSTGALSSRRFETFGGK